VAETNESDSRLGRRLDGWKEIANFLGRGTRTAQRWEEHYRLPVRRHGQGNSATVFAFERELTEWLVTSEALSASADQDADSSDNPTFSAPASPQATPPQATVAWWRMRRVQHLLLVVLLAAAAFGLWEWSHRSANAGDGAQRPKVPSKTHVDVDALVVTTASGEELWRVEYDAPIQTDMTGAYPAFLKSAVDDFDGDGRREVLFIPSLKGARENLGLQCFDADGHPRWTYHHADAVRFGDEVFSPPFRVVGFVTTPAPEDETRTAIWAISDHYEQYPSLLQRIDVRTGKPTSTYWSNGYITAVSSATRNGRRILYVGASNNEFKAASLAELDASHPTGFAPAAKAKYRCQTCLPGTPETFIVFPKPERFGRTDATGSVEIIDLIGPSEIDVRVIHAWHPGAPNIRSTAIYRFAPSFALIHVDPADGYMATYSALVDLKMARAGFAEPGRTRDEFLPLLKWNGSGFSPVREVAPAK